MTAARWKFALLLCSLKLLGEQRLARAGSSRDFPTVFNVTTFGTAGDGLTDDHDAIQRAFDAARVFGATPAQRAIVVIPRGTYLVKAGLQLRANFTTLVIDGRLVLPSDSADWPMQSKLCWRPQTDMSLVPSRGWGAGGCPYDLVQRCHRRRCGCDLVQRRPPLLRQMHRTL